MDCTLQGKLANFEVINDKASVGQVFLENTYKEKVNTKVLKIVGAEKVAEFNEFYKANKDKRIVVSYYISNQREWQGKWFASDVVVNEFTLVEKQDVPVVERDDAPVFDDDKDLPF